MKKTIVTFSVIVSSIALTVGVVYAAGMEADWLRVGQQDIGGVTYFNGTIVNETTGTGGIDNPVTFGDNVRIDGRVYRGATAGTGDTMPFIINDNVEITGDLTVTGSVAAASFEEILSGAASVAGSYQTAALETSTWTGTVYDVCGNELTETSVTVAFTPETATTGTWTSSELNVFNPGLVVCASGETGTYSGSYKVAGNLILAYEVLDPEGTSTGSGYTSDVGTRGNTITLVDNRIMPNIYTVLEKQ